MANVKVNFGGDSYGKIRPLHGVNSGPMSKVFTYDMRPQFIEAGFPYARLHDIEYPYGSGEFVDVHCIFKDFDADENDPASYTFALTDKYLEAIMEVGCEPFYRLGNSIEGPPVKKHVYPPKDYLKWAKICEHIIRHYTEGWANGYNWNIEYWEIWNEPDLPHKANWYGTAEEFYEFYDVAATYLKSKFPHLKIGGPAVSCPEGKFHEGFFEYITTRDHKVPLDFFSWHRYFASVEKMKSGALRARALIDRYGFHDAESIMNEWNYMENWENQSPSYVILKSNKGAALFAAALCTLQSETDVAVATYFEADVVKEWCGFFEVGEMSIGNHGRKASVRPLKPFYAFKAFGELYRMGEAIEVTEGTSETLKAAAAKCDGRCALMVAKSAGEDGMVTVELDSVVGDEIEVRLVDEDHDFEPIARFKTNGSTVKISIPMKADSFAYFGSKIN